MGAAPLIRGGVISALSQPQRFGQSRRTMQATRAFSRQLCRTIARPWLGPRRACLAGQEVQLHWCPNRLSSSRSQPKHTKGMRYRLSSAQAYSAFETWCAENTPFFSLPDNIRVRSALLPFWCFEADITTTIGSNTWMYYLNGPMMMVYAGHTYRRAYAGVCKNPLDSAVPFNPSHHLYLPPSEGQPHRAPQEVDFVDPFEVFETTALYLVQHQVLQHEIDLRKEEFPNSQIHVSLSNVSSHRVLMPAYVFSYTFAGQDFRVFINGRTGEGFGAQQASMASMAFRSVRGFFGDPESSGLASLLQTLSNPMRSPWLVTTALGMVRPLVELGLRLVMNIPFVLLVSLGGVAGELFLRFSFRRQEARSRAEWQEILREERAAQAVMNDEWRFRPMGTSERDREHARRGERRRGPGAGNDAGSSSSYSSSSSSNRYASYERRDESAYREQASGGYGGAEGASKQLKRPSPVDARNPYDVLGIGQLGRRADKAKISEAFRLQLMKHHPDHNRGKDVDHDAYTERTRLIIEAYKRLRDPSKRRDVDAMYG